MSTLAYRSTNTKFFFVAVAILLVTAAGILNFGPAPITVLYVVPWFFVLFHYHPLLLMLLWPVLLFIEVIFSDGLFVFPGSLSIIPTFMDPAYFFTIVYLITNAMTRNREFIDTLKENLFLSLFIAIVVAHIILYTPLYGKSAIGEARKFYFFFMFPLLVMLSVKELRDLRGLMLAIMFLAVGISTVGFLRLILGQGFEDVLPAGAALILLFAVFSIPVFHVNGIVITSRIFDAAMFVLFLSLIVMTQHRTVLLAGALGLFLLFGLYRDRIFFLSKAAMAMLAILTVVGIVIVSVPKFDRSLTRSLGGIINPYSDGNASWRIMGWQQQLSRLSRESFLFGEGLGGYYYWTYEGTGVIASPHNGYIQIILKLGLLGLVVYGFLVFRFFRKMLKVRRKLPPGPMRAYVEAGILNFGAAHAYLIGYGFSPIMFIFLGLAMSTVRLLENSWRVPRIVSVKNASHLNEMKQWIPRFI